MSGEPPDDGNEEGEAPDAADPGIDPPEDPGIDPPEGEGEDEGDESASGAENGNDVPAGREGPLADVADEIDRWRERDREVPTDHFEDAVEETEVDREELWRQVAGEDAAERVAEVDPDVPEAAAEPAAERVRVEDRTERVVEKSKYCQKCEYFTPPPEVRCTHEGTEIAELVDVDTFRVFDCPVVAEDEELEKF